MKRALAAVLALALAASAARAQEFSFVALGHTRGGPGNGVIPRERLDEAIAAVRALEPDFVVLTGDLVWGDYEVEVVDGAAVERDWEAVDAVFAQLGVPVHRAVGNHDIWEATTRDLWTGRYGEPYYAFEHEGCRMIVLCSTWIPPAGDTSHLPGGWIRGYQLPQEQIDFLERELAAARDAPHAFVFQHQMLWWDPQARWWQEVHPLLVGTPVRAVIAGDLGPWKFSRAQRDGVEYVQASVEFADPPLVMQRNRESIRLLTSQLDTFLEVQVEGPDVRYTVHTLGGMTTDKHSPQQWHAVNAHDEGTIQRKLWRRWHSPERMLRGALLVGGGAFTGGLALGLLAALLLLGRARRR